MLSNMCKNFSLFQCSRNQQCPILWCPIMKLNFDYKFRFYKSKINEICLHCHLLYFYSIILSFEQCATFVCKTGLGQKPIGKTRGLLMANTKGLISELSCISLGLLFLHLKWHSPTPINIYDAFEMSEWCLGDAFGCFILIATS